MSILKRLEKALDDRMRGIFASSQEGAREGIELYRDALQQVSARATVGSRGDRVFPFDRLRIELHADSAERRAVLEALFEPAQMREDIRAGLLEERIATPEGLSLLVEYPSEAVVEMRLFFEKGGAVPKAEPAPMAPLLVKILEGAAASADLILQGNVVNVGRSKDVVDAMGRIVRRNQLCFPEDLSPDLNSTVSRAHATLRCNAAEGEWRLFDDGSSMGTAVFRNGVRIEVPAHASRGVGLRSGDEIYFGSVRVRLDPA